MFKAGFLRVTAIAGLLLGGCDHPLYIVGEGDIYSASGERNCRLEDQPCSNLVTGHYQETYYALPRDGWEFAGWDYCSVDIGPCTFDVSAEVVEQYLGQTAPPLIARFTPIQRPAGNKNRVLLLGDSITQGDGAYPGYRRPLWHKLIRAGYDVDFVGSQRGTHSGSPQELLDFDLDHEGHWGWEAGQIDTDIAIWLQGYTADIALIHLGTNDVIRVQNNAETAREIGRIIDKLRLDNPNIVILLAKIIPIGAAKDVTVLNGHLEVLAGNKHSASSPVVIVDQYSGYNPYVDSYDPWHPNASGEEKMAQKWFDAMRPHLN